MKAFRQSAYVHSPGKLFPNYNHRIVRNRVAQGEFGNQCGNSLVPAVQFIAEVIPLIS
jgi:hypothetical protein